MSSLPAALPADISLGRVRLRIANLERSLEFYIGRLGLHPLEQDHDSALLATAPDAARLVSLHQIPGTEPRPEYAIGLYHFAILFPSRALLGRKVLDLLRSRWPFTGFADHGVSEAAYLSDPDGNGIELYADRPRDAWPGAGASIVMYTRPLDLEGLLADADHANSAHLAQTRMGHMHLHVSSLQRAREFYVQLLGFEVTTDEYPGARFLAADSAPGREYVHMGVDKTGHNGAVPDVDDLDARRQRHLGRLPHGSDAAIVDHH